MELFNLQATIQLDTSDYENGISNIESGASDVESAFDDIGSAASGAESGLSDVGSAGSDASGDLSDVGGAGSDASGGLDDAADSAGDTGDQLWDLAERAGGSFDAFSSFSNIVDTFVSAGIAAATIGAIKDITTALYEVEQEAEESTATIAQGTGATGEDLEGLSESARTAFANVSTASSTSLDSVSNTLAELNTRFGITGYELEDTTTTMEEFATITGQNGADAVDSIANVMSYWGLEMEDMPGLLDDITTASQGSQASASELENALYSNAGQFQSLGYSVEDALAFLTAYSANGGDVSEATRIMRTAITNLSDSTDDVPGAFQAAIDAISECDTTAEALQTQVGDTGLTVEDVFGSTNAQKIAQNILMGTSSVEDWSAALEDNQGVMEQTVADSVTLKDQMKQGMANIKVAVKDAMDFSSKSYSEGMQAQMEAQQTANETNLENWENFKTGVSEKFENVKSTLSDFGENLSTNVTESVTNFKDNAVTAFDNFKTSASDRFANVKSTVSDWGSKLKGDSSATTFADTAKGKFESFKTNASTLFGNVTSTVKSWGSTTTSTGNTSMSQFVSAISSRVGNARSAAESVASAVSEKLSNLKNQASTWASDMMENFRKGIENAKEKVKTAASNVASAVKSVLGFSLPEEGPLSDADTYMPDFMSLLAKGIKDSESEVVDNATDLAQSVSDAMDFSSASANVDMSGTISNDGSVSGSQNSKGITIIQNIYSQAQTAADLMREARYEQKRALLTGIV